MRRRTAWGGRCHRAGHHACCRRRARHSPALHADVGGGLARRCDSLAHTWCPHKARGRAVVQRWTFGGRAQDRDMPTAARHFKTMQAYRSAVAAPRSVRSSDGPRCPCSNAEGQRDRQRHNRQVKGTSHSSDNHANHASDIEIVKTAMARPEQFGPRHQQHHRSVYAARRRRTTTPPSSPSPIVISTTVLGSGTTVGT